MARPKSATHDLKRDEILDVAAQCFARQSFPAASMNDIATDAMGLAAGAWLGWRLFTNRVWSERGHA
jgi:AcrR family transcriptional regulator